MLNTCFRSDPAGPTVSGPRIGIATIATWLEKAHHFESHPIKGRASIVLYALAIGLAFVNVWVAQAIYVGVALMWLIPDRRIERVVHAKHPSS